MTFDISSYLHVCNRLFFCLYMISIMIIEILYRTSEAAKHNYYSLIDHLYSGENMQHVNLGMFNASNYTLVGIYNSTAHNKNDMIVR